MTQIVNIPNNFFEFEQIKCLNHVDVHQVPYFPDGQPWSRGYTFFLFNGNPPWLKEGMFGLCIAKMRGKVFWFENTFHVNDRPRFLVSAKGLLLRGGDGSSGMANVGLTPLKENEEIKLCFTNWTRVNPPQKLYRSNWVTFKAPARIQYPEEITSSQPSTPQNSRITWGDFWESEYDKGNSNFSKNRNTVFGIGCTLNAHIEDPTLAKRESDALYSMGLTGVHLAGSCIWWGNDRWNENMRNRPDPDQKAIDALDRICYEWNKKGGRVHLWVYGKRPAGTAIPMDLFAEGWEQVLLNRIGEIYRKHGNLSIGSGYDNWHDNWASAKANQWVIQAKKFVPLVGMRNYEHRPWDVFSDAITVNENELPQPKKADFVTLKKQSDIRGAIPFMSDRFEASDDERLDQFNRRLSFEDVENMVTWGFENRVWITIGYRPQGIQAGKGTEVIPDEIRSKLYNLVYEEDASKPESPSPKKPTPEKPKRKNLFQKIIEAILNIFK